MQLDVVHLGLLPYRTAWDRQLEVHAEVLAETRPSTLLLVEHPPTITLGANSNRQNLLFSAEEMARRGIDLVQSDRGGDVTYHAPGQLVVYPIIRLQEWGTDLHRYLRALESAVIEVAASFGVEAGRNPVNTGVWVGNRKLCAMGIRVQRRVTLHGIACNCNTDLDGFRAIVPCGIQGDYGVTSLSQELGRVVEIAEVEAEMVGALRRAFA